VHGVAFEVVDVASKMADQFARVPQLDVNFVFGDASISITGGSASAPPLAALPGSTPRKT
jgi:hypothetical protein